MALTWDLTKIKFPDEYKLWLDNPDPNRTKDEDQVMNAVTEMMIFLTMMVGINEITQKNYKDFHHRIEQFQLATASKGLLVSKENPEVARNPNLEEIKWHIGLHTNATPYTKRKWTGHIMRMLDDTIRMNAAKVKESLNDNKGDA